MSNDAPDVRDYTSAEWRQRDTRRAAAYDIARKLGIPRDAARRTADEVAEQRGRSTQVPRSSGNRSTSEGCHVSPGTGCPFSSYLKLPE